MKNLLFVATLLSVSATGCSHAPADLPRDVVIVDRTNPKHTIVEFNGDCKPRSPQLENRVTQDGKTYYFSSEAERDKFLQTYAFNSRY